MREWREGLKNYRRLIDEFPEDPEESPYRTCRTCGGIFNGTSLIDYNIMLPGGPNSANSHHGLLSEAKTPEDAIALSKEFIQLAPELDTIRYHGLYQLAGSLRRLGDSRKADEAMAELGLCDRWLVAGPFHTKGDDSRRMVFEAELDALRGSVDVTKEYPAATEDGRDGIAMWSRTSSVSGDEVLETHPRYHFVTAVGAIYALTNVTCPRPRKAQIRVGTSGQCRVWISGRVVPTGEVQELPSALVDANVWPIDLQAGEHQLLIRFDLSGNYGSNQNYVRLTTRDGHRLKDISYSVPAVSDDNRSRSTFMK